MANSIMYKDHKLAVGDVLDIDYRIKEGDKERIQLFSGILIKVRGEAQHGQMITVRKISRSGIGIERVIPLQSPFISSIKVAKPSENTKSKLYYIRRLSDQQLRSKLFRKKLAHKKSTHQKAAPKVAVKKSVSKPSVKK